MSNGTEGVPSPDLEFRSVHAIRDALPTRAHAEMLFSMVAAHLGDEAYLETWNGESSRTIFRRESPGSAWIVPWPLISVARGGREGPSPIMTAIPGVYEEPKTRPGPAPKIRGLGPGQVTIHDGSQYVTICYGADGRWFECSVSAPPQEAFAGVVAALAEKNASPTEIVAAFVAGLDRQRHGPGRILLPVPLPHGVQGVWNCGLFAIRDALFDGRVPGDARWVVADGWLGGAIGFGPTRDAAVARWRSEVARVRPFPVKPTPPDEPPPEPSAEQSFDGEQFSMRVTLRGPASDVPWVDPTVENSPAVVLPIPETPAESSPLGEWVRLADGFGNVRAAAIRHEASGFTLIGDALLGLDLTALDTRLDAADREWDERQRRFVRPEGFPEPPPTDCSVRTYRLAGDGTRVPVKPTVSGAARRSGFDARGLDGATVRSQVVRLRWDGA